MYDYSFETKISKKDFGKYFYTVVWLDPKLIDSLPLKKYPRLRVEASIEGAIVEGAFTPDKGRWYLILNKQALKKMGQQIGSTVLVEFSVVDQDAVKIPKELRIIIEEDADFAQAWSLLTLGKQRGYAYTIVKAKTKPTIEKRLLWLYDEVMN